MLKLGNLKDDSVFFTALICRFNFVVLATISISYDSMYSK